jgi:hypothetical protein
MFRADHYQLAGHLQVDQQTEPIAQVDDQEFPPAPDALDQLIDKVNWT